MEKKLRVSIFTLLVALVSGCGFSRSEPPALLPSSTPTTGLDAATGYDGGSTTDADLFDALEGSDAFEGADALDAPDAPDAVGSNGGDGGAGLDAESTGDAGISADAEASDATDASVREGDAGTAVDGGRDRPNPLDPSSDYDCDGASDAQEQTAGTNPLLSDTDLDGLSDAIELGISSVVVGSTCPPVALDGDPATRTNPLVFDTDGDGLADGVEDRDHDGRRASDELDPKAADTDRDGLLDAFEDRNRNGVRDFAETDGTVADTDGDGLLDGVEDLNHDGLRGPTETDPLVNDTDGDGLLDAVEDANRDGLYSTGETMATLFDTDLDGLSDGCEDRDHDGVRDASESDPRVADTDGDGLSDGTEDANRDCVRGPLETNPASADSDCDGLSDVVEIARLYARNVRTNPLVADSDGDGLTDGVEAGASTSVAGSDCANVVLDAQPATRTDPTLADTDGDGRSDGCEDRNRNGRRDRNEMDPLSVDSDGDTLPDNIEDADGSCSRNGRETSATSADTDLDGALDPIELAMGTDPLTADSDADGLPDGIEDANHDGVVQSNETNPLTADTDGDGLRDGVEDADHDGVLDPGESDPRRNDTDGDGLSDATEVALGTDPSDVDSDHDLLLDGDEVTRGTMPLDPDTDNDGVLDGDEVIVGTNPLDPNDPSVAQAIGINSICAASALKVVQFDDHVAGDTQVALESSFVYAPATVTAGDSAAVFADDTLGISGFVAAIAPPSNTQNPTTQAQALLARLSGGMARLGATGVSVQNNGRSITTHDGFESVVDIRVRLVLGTQASAAAVRNKVLAVLSGHELVDFTGLPASGGGDATTYIVRFESLVRPSPLRVVIVGALVSESRFNSTSTAHRATLEDLSNGTALARAWATNSVGCDPLVSQVGPRADFLWMADISGSTDNDRGTIASAADTLFTALRNNGVDFRMGVVPHSENHINLGTNNGGHLRGSGFTRDRATFIGYLNDTSGATGCEFGLTAVDDALVRALPRTAVGAAENARRLRADAQLVVFYISDEHAQEVEKDICGFGNIGTGLTDAFSGNHETNDPTSRQQQAIDRIVAPFISRIRTNGGIAFAQINPLQAPFCLLDFTDTEEEGYGYFETVTGTGGTFYRVCDSNPGAVLQDIIDAVAGAASDLILEQTPISATIKVGITRARARSTTVVPRSSVDGFDYDPAANAIFFRGGTYRPQIGDQVTVSYRVFGPPRAPVVCAPPLVLNTITSSCECPESCGLDTGCARGMTCDRDPAVCACACDLACGGICSSRQACDPTTCQCACAPNCGGACTANQLCDSASCSCVCPANCGGACSGNRVCDSTSCACVCPADCGGCPRGQTCDVGTCSCVGGSL